MLGVSLIIIAAAAVYMVEAYIHTYYAIEYMHGAPLFFVLLAKYAAPVLFLLLCGYFVFRYMEKRRESEKPVQDKLVNREEAYTRATKLVLEKKEYAVPYFLADSKSPKSIRARWSRTIWMNT